MDATGVSWIQHTTNGFIVDDGSVGMITRNPLIAGPTFLISEFYRQHLIFPISTLADFPNFLAFNYEL